MPGSNNGNYVWDSGTLDDGQSDPTFVRFQRAVYSGMLTAPHETIFIDERIAEGNYFGDAGWAETPSASSQFNNAQSLTDINLHGKDTFNYTFADGHAETLLRQATLGTTNTNTGRQSGMWTISPIDN